MKRLSLKNNIEVNLGNIRSLMNRIRFKPDQNTQLAVPAIVLKRMEFSIKCLQKIDVSTMLDRDMKIEMFSNPLKHKILKKVENGFTDTSTIGVIVDAKTWGAMKTINPNEYITTPKDVLDATELLVGIDVVRRKSMLISSTSLISKNKNGNNTNVSHIEIAIWDGYINSPNSYIIYIEKFIDRYRFTYLEKIAVDIDRFKYNIYDFDCDSKLLHMKQHRSISIEDDILHVVSSQPDLYRREELFNRLYDRYSLIPAPKKNRRVEEKSNDKTTEIIRHKLSKKITRRGRDKEVKEA